MQNIAQIKAADPSYSVWVSASAGTGKTKVLTDRVLRLLLQNVQPSKILCLTFTKAAATEMMHRINNELISWSIMTHDKLSEKLTQLLGRQSTEKEKISAQNLFITLQNSLTDIQIHTIHGFCHSILRLFPLESGIKPGFILISDFQAAYILKKITQDIQSKYLTSEILWPITKYTHEQVIEDLISEIINKKNKFQNLINKFKTYDAYKLYLQNILNIKHHNISEILSKLFITLKKHGILEQTNDTEANKIIDRYNDILLNTDDLAKKYLALKSIFLTSKSTARSKILSKKALLSYPDLEIRLSIIQNNFCTTHDAINSLNIIEMSVSLFSLAALIIESYEAYKLSHGYIDYDDLINITYKLLANDTFNSWVNYKLDGFVSHILVDEAQDTSLEQWNIINAITQEFYAGLGTSDTNKSLFIVGDAKQSIYSFQGGDVEVFLQMSHYISTQMQYAQKKYHTIELEHGYRSSRAVNNFISILLDRINNISNSIFPKSSQLECIRQNHTGRIEIWPLISNSIQTNFFWPIFNEPEVELDLASNIATYIKDILDNHEVLSSTGLPVEPKDIMILVRRRNSFTNHLIYTIQKAGLPIDGIDRISLTESLTIQDIISLAKFVLQPLDDLNLACLLKSPFVEMPEIELQNLIGNRKDYIFHTIQNDTKLLLQQFSNLNQMHNAYDFIRIILDVYGYREKLLRINGYGEADVIDTFLEFLLDFTQNISSSLQEFISWFIENPPEVKREFGSRNKIRVMTVHAAKGLESGIVILADTTTVPQTQSKVLWSKNGDAYYNTSSENTNNYINILKQDTKLAEYNEYLRLLYVAVTRAADVLIVCGNPSNNIDNNSWYSILLETMQTMEYKTIKYSFYDQEILVYSPNDSNPFKITPKSINTEIRNIQLSKHTLPNKTILSLITEHQEYKNVNIPIKFNQIGRDVFYGEIFHKILEDVITTRDLKTVDTHHMLHLLPITQQHFVIQQLYKLFELYSFQEILQMQTYTEVSIANKYDGISRIGRVDLLAMSDTKIIIIDYKTDKNTPVDIKKINNQYIEQLKFYKSTLELIYKDHYVEAKILWLENLTFHTI